MRQPLRRRLRRGSTPEGAPADPTRAASEATGSPSRTPLAADPPGPAPDGTAPATAGPPLADPPAAHAGAPDEQAVGDRQATYAAWAERMRNHKKAKLAGLAPDPESGSRPAAASPYWDAANLFVPADEPDPTDPAQMTTRDLLGLLGLAEGATDADLQAAFRRLAKEHHPDRWFDSPPEVRREHEDRMALVTEAHRELRRRGL